LNARSQLPSLTLVWLALVALSLGSLGLGGWLHGSRWLPLLVAGIVWLKCFLVARRFIEVESAHPFVARIVAVFIALAPAALVLTSFFGDAIARWASL
jgi:hypothetical protein